MAMPLVPLRDAVMAPAGDGKRAGVFARRLGDDLW
jgi:hypothetical protein